MDNFWSTWRVHGVVMLESLSKNNVFMRVTFESPSKMLHVHRNINISHVSSVFQETLASIYQASHVGGWGSKAEGSPTGKSSSEFDVFAPAPAPHARHDRSTARKFSAARPKPPDLCSQLCFGFQLRRPAPRDCGVASCSFVLILARENNGFVQDMDSLCSSHVIKIRVLRISS